MQALHSADYRRPKMPALPLLQVDFDDAGGIPPAHLAIDHCLRLPQGLILVSGWLLDPSGCLSSLALQAGEASTRLDLLPKLAQRPRPDVDRGLAEVYAARGFTLSDATARGFCAVIPLDPSAPAPRELSLTARWAWGELAWPVTIETDATQARVLLSEAGLWLGAALRAWPEPWRIPPEWAPELALRGVAPSDRVRLELDAALQVDGGLFLAGWGIDAMGRPLEDLFLFSSSDQQAVLAPKLGHLTRPDVVEHLRLHREVPRPDLGFVAWVPDCDVVPGSASWTVTAPDGMGGLVSRPVAWENAATHPTALDTLLRGVPLHNPEFRAIYDRHVGPALEAYFAPVRKRVRPAASILDFGVPCEKPEVSIIVPLYGRWDFLEYQLAQFRNDPDLAGAELIYFVDDPSIYDAIVQYWRNTHPIYEHPFRLAFCGQNLGFAGANNAAVELARGDLVLLMNSDVMPAEPGWLTKLTQALALTPNAGVVGPLLMYGDGAVQHAGMGFSRNPHWGDLWTNLHPGKGLPATWFSGDAAREVPALTGACMLMPRARFLALGGFDEGYIRGDFEDSDLCLKVRAEGLVPVLVPDIRMFHLERQSQGLNSTQDTRTWLTIYNGWRHTRRWDRAIEQLTGLAL